MIGIPFNIHVIVSGRGSGAGSSVTLVTFWDCESLDCILFRRWWILIMIQSLYFLESFHMPQSLQMTVSCCHIWEGGVEMLRALSLRGARRALLSFTRITDLSWAEFSWSPRTFYFSCPCIYSVKLSGGLSSSMGNSSAELANDACPVSFE